MKAIVEKLKQALQDSAKAHKASGLLFSGGLDSSILAGLDPNMKAITVNLESYGSDINYSNSVSDFLGMERFHRIVAIDEAIEAIPEVIKALKSFDPAIPNDLAVYFGLKFAKEKGIKEIATGDGSDELFGGYDFMQEIDNLDGYIRRISQKMWFSSNILGEFFKIDIKQPYMDKSVVDFALDIPQEFKIKHENGKSWGKWILRKAFEGVLPPELIWQSKRPLEYGSGMTKLREIISAKVSDEEFRENDYPVTFLNKEHFYYYKVYVKTVGQIPRPKGDENPCPGCAAGMERDAFHCKICGYVKGVV